MKLFALFFIGALIIGSIASFFIFRDVKEDNTWDDEDEYFS